jgi:ABC-2 type transport system ATP-binding protein
VISAAGLSRSFDGRPAVEELSFELPSGSLLALLGPNGAGKTTTIRLLLGLIQPTSGTATVAGIPLSSGEEARRTLRGSCGFLTETPGFYDRRTALDNLNFFARLYDIAQPVPQIERQLRAFDLWEHRDKPVGTFSKGMKQRLAIIRALFHEPRVLFLDEPTAGLDPESALEVRELIARLKTEGRTIVVCTHNLDEAERLADWVGILRRRLLAFDTLENLQRGNGSTCSIRFGLGRAGPEWRDRVSAIAGVEQVVVEGIRLKAAVRNPGVTVPVVVAALVAAGAEVHEVVPERSTLEAAYLACIRESE